MIHSPAKLHRRAAFAFLLALLVAGLSGRAWAEGEGFRMELGEWRWSAGDDPARAAPAYDDSAWIAAGIPAAIKPGPIGAVFWLRAEVELPGNAPGRIWLLIGKSSPACEVFVDGTYAGSRGSLPPDFALGATRSSAFLLPFAGVPGSRHVIALRCAFNGSVANLKSLALLGEAEAAVELGPSAFWNGTLYKILAALCLFIGCYSLLQFALRVQGRSDLYYAATMLFLSFYLYELGSDRLFVEAAWIRAVARGSLAMSLCFLCAFFTVFFKVLDSPRLRSAAIGLGLAIELGFLIVSRDATAVEGLFTVALLPVVAAIGFCGYVDVRALRRGSREARFVLVAVAVGIGLAGYDSYYKAVGREPFAWLQGIAFFVLNAAIFVTMAMRQARLKAELDAYAREAEAKKAELAGYLDRIVAAGAEAAEIAGELDAAASAARDSASSSARAARGVDERSESQAKSASRTDELVAGFSASASEVDRRISDQAGGVERTASAAIELSAGAESVAGNVEQAARFTSGLAEQTAAGQAAARSLGAAMAKIQESSAGIGEVIEAMDQFSERTNLLAMNAAIEAAHAGQSGRGFAIIASEVKKLAQAQSERAGRIREELLGIGARVSAGAGDAERLGVALADMARGAVGAAQRLAEVLAATKEQAAASVEIRDAMSELSASAQAIREESQRQAEMAEKASAAVAAVSAGAAGLREDARAISREGAELEGATSRLVSLAARCRDLTATLAASGTR